MSKTHKIPFKWILIENYQHLSMQNSEFLNSFPPLSTSKSNYQKTSRLNKPNIEWARAINTICRKCHRTKFWNSTYNQQVFNIYGEKNAILGDKSKEFSTFLIFLTNVNVSRETNLLAHQACKSHKNIHRYQKHT